MSNVEVFLASSNTPLPLEVDSYPLGGNQLHIKGRWPSGFCFFEESHVDHQVAAHMWLMPQSRMLVTEVVGSRPIDRQV